MDPDSNIDLKTNILFYEKFMLICVIFSQFVKMLWIPLRFWMLFCLKLLEKRMGSNNES